MTHGPVLGEVTHESVRVWVRTGSAQEVACEILDDAGGGVVARARTRTGGADDFAATLRIEGLSPASPYRYRIRVGGRLLEDPAWRFRTAPPPGTPVRMRIAVTSCFREHDAPDARAYRALASLEPDLVLALGDNVYIDSTATARQRIRYRRLRSIGPIAELAARVPTLAIWDDHDFGPNNADGTTPGKESSLACFLAYWPNPPPALGEGAGCAFSAVWGDVGIWMLDGRWFRTPPGGPGSTMLGEAQTRWLTESLAASPARLKLVGIGTTWGDFNEPSDSWMAYPKEREALFAEWARRGIDGIVLLSGDTHYCSAWRHEFPGLPLRYEINSSGIGRAWRWVPLTRDGMLRLSEGIGECFWILDVDTAGATPGFEGTIRDRDGAAVGEPLRIRLADLECVQSGPR